MNDSISTQEIDLWTKLITDGGLWGAWQKVRLNAGGAGGDGVSVIAFERQAPRRVEALRHALETGQYRPGPFRHVDIPKQHGGLRPLDIPCVSDRIIQSAAATLLSTVLDGGFSPDSFAYRPHRGVARAVQRVLRLRRDGYRWTAEGDVAHCFEEIPQEMLLDRLHEACGDARITDLVALWLECFNPRGIGIPQGSPISPLLCNLHLDAVDQAIVGHGVRLVRFADDFVLLAKTEQAASAGLERMAALLRAHGLEMNPDKTAIRAFDQSLRFLGHVFTRGMAWKEVSLEDDGPAWPDAPPEETLAQFITPQPGAAFDKPGEERGRRRNVLYLLSKGSRLSSAHHSFTVSAPGPTPDTPPDARLAIHADRLDRIEIGAGASADWHALQLAAAHGVSVAMVDGWGQTMGLVIGNRDLRAGRVMAQARWLAIEANRDLLALALVRGRVRNQRALLRRLNRDRKDSDIAAAAVALRGQIKALPVSCQVDAARGYEGWAAARYWPAYGRAFDDGFGFSGLRDRRPPPDPINAALGYLAALLERDIRVAIERVGLHSGMGSLHVPRDGNDALIYDLMEAFRAPVCEGLLTALTGRRVILPHMFVIADFIRPDGSHQPMCRMENVAKKALILGYENWIGRTIKSPRTGNAVLWRDLFEQEVRALLALFANEADTFEPYEMDW